jgi:hypothetical protein
MFERCLDVALLKNKDTNHSQSFCMSMITRAVVFGSNELSCGHWYGEASMLDSILDIDKVEIVEARRILWSETTCFAGPALLVRLGFGAQNMKQLDRVRVKRRVEVAGFRCFSSVLIRGSFELVSTLGGAYWA